jgi:hypothetical protein
LLINLLTRSSCACSFVRLLICLLARLLTCSFAHSFVRLFVHLLVWSFVRPPTLLSDLLSSDPPTLSFTDHSSSPDLSLSYEPLLLSDQPLYGPLTLSNLSSSGCTMSIVVCCC